MAAYAWNEAQTTNSPLDDYELVGNIGSGGFGEAGLYRDRLNNGSLCVLKKINVLKYSGLMSADTEINALSSLKHCNIVDYKDSFTCGDWRYIVMEYCEGGDLAKRIAHQMGLRTAFDLDTVKIWTWQMCSGLEYIHGQDVIHRYLKPPNIFLTRTANVKIGDFGIARDLAPGERAYTVIGTPCYMSPELCRGESYTNKTDIWSLGCIVYELLGLQAAMSSISFNDIGQWLITPLPVDGSDRELVDLAHSMLTFDKRERPDISQLVQTDVMRAAEMISKRRNDVQVQVNAGAASRAIVVNQEWSVDKLYSKMVEQRISTAGNFELFTTDRQPVKNKVRRKKVRGQIGNVTEPVYVEDLKLQPPCTIVLRQKVVGG